MRTLTAVQVIIAAAFLLVGVIALFGIGVTGLIFLVPGIAFAALAGVTDKESRAAVALALSCDGALAYFAAAKLQALFSSAMRKTEMQNATISVLKPEVIKFIVPSTIMILVLSAVIGVPLDWRKVRASKWF